MLSHTREQRSMPNHDILGTVPIEREACVASKHNTHPHAQRINFDLYRRNKVAKNRRKEESTKENELRKLIGTGLYFGASFRKRLEGSIGKIHTIEFYIKK